MSSTVKSPLPRSTSLFSRQAKLKMQSMMTAPAVMPKVVETDANQVEITVVINKIIYKNEDNGFMVLSVTTEDNEELSVRGSAALEVIEGESAILSGDFGTYKGRKQFVAKSIRILVPTDTYGVVKWLKRTRISGVGPVMAEKIGALFPENASTVIGNAEALVDAGIKPEIARLISERWNRNLGSSMLESRLLSLGFNMRQIISIASTFGGEALHILDTDIWKFVEANAVGFLTVDKAARLSGFQTTSSSRIRAGLRWVFSEITNSNGHCYLDEEDIIPRAAELLGVDQDIVISEMKSFIDGVSVVRCPETGKIFDGKSLAAEKVVASRIRSMKVVVDDESCPSEEKAIELIEAAENELGVRLDRDGGQFEAAIAALTNKVSIITGGPGTGKSTTQAVIIHAYSALIGRLGKIKITAPTGRAAKRLTETAKSGLVATTIHRLLEYKGNQGFQRNSHNPIDADVVIVDETSMVDISLFASLLRAIPLRAHVVLVGDADQLPSVGPGQVLHDLIDSGEIPVSRLTKVHRQSEGSGIAIAAQRINNGLTPLEDGRDMSGFGIISCRDEAVTEKMLGVILKDMVEAGFDPMQDVQVIAPMRKGEHGVEALNIILKNTLNPVLDDGRTKTINGVQYTIGDRIMQIKNNYEIDVFNGEVGTVADVGRSESPDTGAVKSWINVNYSGEIRTYTDGSAMSNDIRLAYASTVHKVQGCEAPAVVFIVSRAHKRMLSRNLLYTGITRARSHCVILGDRSVIDSAPKNVTQGGRKTMLAARLRNSEFKDADIRGFDEYEPEVTIKPDAKSPTTSSDLNFGLFEELNHLGVVAGLSP